MDFEQFMDSYGSTSLGADLIGLGPTSARVLNRVGDEHRMRMLVASTFWRAFLASDAYDRALKGLGASSQAWMAARPLVAIQKRRGRFDLLVLDAGLPAGMTPRHLTIDRKTFRRAEVAQGVTVSARGGVSPLIGLDYADLVAEAAYNPIPFNLVLAPLPPMERMSVPSPALMVDDLVANANNRGGANSISTAGAVVICKQSGLIGVTAALHGVVAAQNNVEVGGKTGTLVRTDRVTDSAFIEVDVRNVPHTKPTSGVMRGMLPRGQQSATFIGHASQYQQQNTTITGFDPQLPSPSVNRQALLYTGRDAQHGDSGAALVTDDGYLVGFAFEQTLFGASPQYCSWVWADSVLTALNVSL